MLVMSLSPLLGAPSPAESPPDFSKDLPTFFQECSFYLEKPYFLVRQRTSRLFASPAEDGKRPYLKKSPCIRYPPRWQQRLQAGRRVKPYANQPAVTAIMQDYALYNYSHARRSVRSTLNPPAHPLG